MESSLDQPQLPSGVPQIDFRAQLNDEQFNAVTAPPGPLLVLAGAGSGKTRTLTYRVAYLLSQGVRPGEILLLTFTNKAAKEMLHRVHDLTGVEPARFWGGTFHSLGHRALRLYGEAVGLPRNFTILDADESESLLKQVVDAEDKPFFKDKTNPRPGPLFNVLSLARNTQVSLADAVRRDQPPLPRLRRRLPREEARPECRGLRRPARALARPSPQGARGRGLLRPPLPACAGRRVPGHQHPPGADC
jgi:DNA helicase-2/ATP-dependent DNA helicase PcrA